MKLSKIHMKELFFLAACLAFTPAVARADTAVDLSAMSTAVFVDAPPKPSSPGINEQMMSNRDIGLGGGAVLGGVTGLLVLLKVADIVRKRRDKNLLRRPDFL